ncbi:helix-turn-helix transcriptional regulator [Fodinisporobacter ferrooxydans]|uniref:Helix-turn-helix transcriptional regulator n=1 Tax=Fodinisporobacter ferrooxydans TaxID=2901836 RepID=A0ABY4CGG4_9BACL|nr:helix-turn-helix transcriptional regulator [Alicyclobacillaceae bacterium MYW30-H2]
MKPASVLFTLIGDFYRNLDMKVWVGSLIQYMEQFAISDGTVRVTLSRMVQQGLIESHKVGQKGYYSVTDKGRRRVKNGISRVYNFEDIPWDGNWRIVLCNMAELEKDSKENFKKELQWTGYGYLGNNTWISPHNRHSHVISIADEYGISDHVDLFTGRYDGPESYRRIVEKAWDFCEIEEQYKLFLQKFEPEFQRNFLLSMDGNLTESDAFVQRIMLVHEYRKFLFIDPRLPKEVLPSDWIGDEARSLFRKYHQFLSPLAEKFFYQNLVVMNEGEEGIT